MLFISAISVMHCRQELNQVYPITTKQVLLQFIVFSNCTHICKDFCHQILQRHDSIITLMIRMSEGYKATFSMFGFF